MADRINPAEREEVLHWIREGAPEERYRVLKSVFDKDCIACHSGKPGSPLPPLSTYEGGPQHNASGYWA